MPTPEEVPEVPPVQSQVDAILALRYATRDEEFIRAANDLLNAITHPSSAPVPLQSPVTPPVETEEDREEEEEEEETYTCRECGNDHTGEPALVEQSYNWRVSRPEQYNYCPDCITRCEHCDQMAPNRETREAIRYNRHSGRDTTITICDECYCGHYIPCDSCSDVREVDYMVQREHLDRWYCADCDPGEELDTEDDDSESSDPLEIQGYHDAGRYLSPIPSPWASSHGPTRLTSRFFGVELEVEMPGGGTQGKAREILSEVHKNAHLITQGRAVGGQRLLVAERDGSLDNGFEMISAPMGLDDHRRLWEVALTPKHRDGLRSHNTTTCGLHVHVSRAGLRPLQIAKMVCFLNHPDNAHLIKTVARRYSNGYCKTKQVKMADATESMDRYEMLNLLNSKTVEFRIFRGSLHIPAVLASIEFANAVTEYCADSSGAGMDLTTESFLHFLLTPRMRKDTKALRSYLKARRFSPFVHLAS